MYYSETWMIYKHQVKMLAQFHHRSFRQCKVCRIHLRYRNSLEKLKRLTFDAFFVQKVGIGIYFFERMLSNFNGNFILFFFLLRYWDMENGKASKPNQVNKGKNKLRTEQNGEKNNCWWCNIILRGERIQHAAYKRVIWKRKQAATAKNADKSSQCEICRRIYISLFSFKSHKRENYDMNQVLYPQQLGFKCKMNVKIMNSKAGITIHLGSHATKEILEEIPWCYTRIIITWPDPWETNYLWLK